MAMLRPGAYPSAIEPGSPTVFVVDDDPSVRTEVERLGAANADLHRELESVADAATAAVERAKAQRHLREQDAPAPTPEATPAQVVDLSEERRTSGAGWQTT